jgi:hypothetical protein
MERCKTCRFWEIVQRDYDPIAHPIDPDTYEPMDLPFEVRLCQHPDILFAERPLKDIGAALMDGSQYMALLYTAENFGCVLHERDA